MSRNYEEIAARFWNLKTKGDEEARRESLFLDDIVQKAHLDREIAAHLDGVRTVFDGGAGSGRFSIPLAQQGFQVTHFDISRPMLAKARELAGQAGVGDRIQFVEGRLTELKQYADGQFDLVLSFDAPVSYCYPRHGEVLHELVRIARKAVVVSVSSRLGYLPYLFSPADKLKYIVDEQADDPAVRWYVKHGPAQQEAWQPDFHAYETLAATGLPEEPEQIYARMEQGGTPWPPNYCFMPDELHEILTAAGLKDIQLAGPGALARTLPNVALRKLLLSEHRDQFLDHCYRYDRQASVCGMGKDNLVASGRK